VNMNNVIEVSPPAAALKMKDFYEWAMLGSNQRPLPCEDEALGSHAFTYVQNTAYISGFRVGDTLLNPSEL
jgi:hypothetical protein